MSEWSRVFGNSSSINKAYGADSERQIKKTLDAAFDAPPDYQGIYTQSALESQVGGDHYTDMKLQPLEKTYLQYGYEGVKHSLYTKVDKYLTRDKGTDRVDIEKAIHCLQLQLEFYDRSKDEVGNK